MPLLVACAAGTSAGSSPAEPRSPSSASATSRGPRVGPEIRPFDVRRALDVAAFITPSAQIVCLINSSGVRCDYFAEDKTWRAPEPANCDNDYGSSVHLDRAAVTACVGDSIVGTAALDSGYGSWRKQGDPEVRWDGYTLVALPDGAEIVLGIFRCDSATAAVTCQNDETGHGFFMSRESYRVF